MSVQPTASSALAIISSLASPSITRTRCVVIGVYLRLRILSAGRPLVANLREFPARSRFWRRVMASDPMFATSLPHSNHRFVAGQWPTWHGHNRTPVRNLLAITPTFATSPVALSEFAHR